MGYINGTMRGQSMLFPVSLDEYVGENNQGNPRVQGGGLMANKVLTEEL